MMEYNKIKVSLFADLFTKADKEPKPLLGLLIGSEYKTQVERVRTAEYHSKQQKALKQKLPVFSMGVFDGERKADNLKRAVPLLALDFDGKDNDSDTANPNLAYRALKHVVKDDPFVLYCGLSCSGKGWRLLLPIPNDDIEQRIGHYLAAVRYFKNRYGMLADEACKDIAHAFFVSYDSEPYVNEAAKPFPYYVDSDRPQQAAATGTAADAIEMLLAIEKAEANKLTAFVDYEDWVKMGLALASTFGEDGRPMFHRLSALCKSKYDAAATDTKYNSLLASTTTGQAATVASIYWQLQKARQAKAIDEDFSNISSDNYDEDDADL